MPPKRRLKQTKPAPKKAKKNPSEEVPQTTKSELVEEVVLQLQPVIQKAVQDAVAATANARAQDSSNEDMQDKTEEDLEVLFRDERETESNQGELEHSLEHSATINLHVPKSVEAKIKREEYITLSELLNQDEQDITLNITNSGNVMVNKKTKQIKISSGEQWFSAFLVYASIYQHQFPQKACQMFQYMSIVQSLQKSFGIEAAVKYDEDFRKMRARTPSMRWDKLQQEIYLLAASKSVHKPQRDRTQPQPFRKTPYCPPGFCRQFNQQGVCTWDNCIYKHECFKCQGDHAARTCRVNEGNKQVSKHLQKQKSKN